MPKLKSVNLSQTESNLAPLVLFTYKRLDTLKKVVDSLAANFLAEETDLIIFSDGPKRKEEEYVIEEVRTYLKTIKGFKSVTIKESPTNKGLASSIIEGVSKIFEAYDNVIVLEDDLITTNNFLAFMNQALDTFKNHKNLYSVSGYAFNFKNENINEDAYLLNRPWPWGWATWKDRWIDIDWDMKAYQSFKKNKNSQKDFQALGSDVNNMLSKQMSGKIDSWYIRFTFHQFMNEGLTIYPKISKVDNAGFDNIATHNKGLKNRFITPLDTTDKIHFRLPQFIQLNQDKQSQLLYKMGLINRAINKIVEIAVKIFKLS